MNKKTSRIYFQTMKIVKHNCKMIMKKEKNKAKDKTFNNF